MSILSEMWRRVKSPRNWRRGAFDGNNGSHCLVGWINTLENMIDNNDREQAEDRLADVIKEQYPERVSGGLWMPSSEDIIMGFNDDPRTMFVDIQRVIEKAAIKEQEEV